MPYPRIRVGTLPAQDREGWVVVAFKRKNGGTSANYESRPFYTSSEIYPNRTQANNAAKVKRQELAAALKEDDEELKSHKSWSL